MASTRIWTAKVRARDPSELGSAGRRQTWLTYHRPGYLDSRPITTESTPAGTPSITLTASNSNSDPYSSNSAPSSDIPIALSTSPKSVAVPTGADPTPNGVRGMNGHAADDIAPPPGIEGMPPLSATAMSSFASAAKGVTTVEEVGEGGNQEGLMVLNKATA